LRAGSFLLSPWMGNPKDRNSPRGRLHRLHARPDESAPHEVISRAISLFDTREVRRSRRHPATLPVVSADLILDSRDRPVPEGVRGGLRLESQLLFSVRGLDIDLRLNPDVASHVACHGQVLPVDGGFLGPERLQVYLRTGSDDMTSLTVSEFGEFAATKLPQGEQTLEILLDSEFCYRLSFVT